MALPFGRDPAAVPMHVLFPDEYRATARRIVLDFVVFGGIIVGGVIVAALIKGL